MNRIVDELATWIKNNSVTLRKSGVTISEKIPEPESEYSWKASVGLGYNGVLVSYTVWERSGFQTELIVMNTLSNKTIIMEDKNPSEPSAVSFEMNQVIEKLLDNTYKNMKPDPKLIIT